MKALGKKIYSRARAGEDFAALQKEAFEAANLDEEPAVDLGKISRSHLRRSHQFIFDLKPGEISALIHETQEGYYIYNVLSKETPSFESAKSEVQTALQKQRMDAWMKNITGSAQTKLNEQYFGPEAAKTGQGQ
jgi:parvulin-like peptidyl-prolyl isomerase